MPDSGQRPPTQQQSCRMIALAVIRRALDDVDGVLIQSDHNPDRPRHEAVRWLFDGEARPGGFSLDDACDAAGLSPERVRREARSRLHAGDPA